NPFSSPVRMNSQSRTSTLRKKTKENLAAIRGARLTYNILRTSEAVRSTALAAANPSRGREAYFGEARAVNFQASNSRTVKAAQSSTLLRQISQEYSRLRAW